MSAPTRRVNAGRGHYYLLDGQKVPGVTTLIGNGLPKPALTKWAANTVANYAIDRWDELAEKTLSVRLKELAGSPWAERDAAAVRGTKVHTLAEQLSRGDEIDVPEHLRGHVESCVRFLDEWDIQPVITEAPVFSRRNFYGGTLDLVADCADGKRRLIDYKTNKSGPFGDAAFQMAAYRYADFYLDDNGDEQPIPPVDECAVVWLRADGYDVYPFVADFRVHRQFLYIAMCAKAAEDARDYKGEALTAPQGAA